MLGGGRGGRRRGGGKGRGGRRRKRVPLPPLDDFVNQDPRATCQGRHAFLVPQEIMGPYLEKARARAERFGSEASTPDSLSVFLDGTDHKPEDHGVLIRNYGDVHTSGHLTLLLGPVSVDTGNTVIVWGVVPREVGNFSFNVACGDNHETFLLHFNPRYEGNRRFSRMMFGTKRDYIWDQGGDELDNRHLYRHLSPGQPFEWRCTVCATGFVVCINGHFVWNYAHRVPVAEVDKPLKLHVAGDVGNDNVAIRAVWWGYLPDADLAVLKNPSTSNDAEMQGLGNIDMTSDDAIKAREARQARFGKAGVVGRLADDGSTAAAVELTPEELERRNKRRERFGADAEGDGVDEAEMMDESKRAMRREVAHDVKRRRNVIHVYGCDQMTESDIRKYFLGFEVVGVRWMDGSSANVQMKDEFTAKNALFRRCTPQAQSDAKAAGLSVFGLNWLEAVPYKKERADKYGPAGAEVKLWTRLATVQDVSAKAMDRPLIQASTVAGQAAAAATGATAAASGSDGSAVALAAAGRAAWDQMMSSYSQNMKMRRRRRRKRGAGASAASKSRRNEERIRDLDAKFERYSQAAREARTAEEGPAAT